MYRCDEVPYHGVQEAAILEIYSRGSQSSDEHRSALLRHLDVVNQTAQQSTTKLRCKSCEHVMTGVGGRIAAQFAQVSGRSVVICSESPHLAREVGKKILRRSKAQAGSAGNGGRAADYL